MMSRKKLPGIYKLKENRLTIVYREGDSPPEEFESTPGSGVTLLVLERPKPETSPSPTGAEANENPGQESAPEKPAMPQELEKQGS